MQSHIDGLLQWLTTAPFALQVLLVTPVVFVLCGALALVWLRMVDITGAVAMRSWDRIITTLTWRQE